ncbi:DUF4479 domain-containing protein [Erysipelotrichaceae bacterium OttesenSCG-928-M19]|nr:DUF4479 domain-containing protein [Erysipelotrichaceae bacterium OttesenSCG-928-M19]
MNYHAFYIDNNLLIRIKDDECHCFTKENNISILYNNKEEVIGYNIFDYNFEGLNEGLVVLTRELHEDINKQLTSIKQDLLDFDDKDYFVVGYVKSIKKHQKSDKLNICQVDIGSEVLQIVCGASNVAQDQKVVVAKVGAVLFNGTWIHKGSLMNVESNGMICSAKELNLVKESTGILVLEDNYKIGEPFVA